MTRRPSRRRLLLAVAVAVLVAEAAAVLIWLGGGGEREGMVHILDARHDFFIDRHEYPNRAGDKPTYMTDLGEARRACVAAGKRLCTDAEWRRACRGPGAGARFSYGPRYQHGVCNTEQAPESGHSGMVNDRGQNITPSGSLPRCRSPEGVFDLVGNLEEWVLSSWQGRGAALEGGAWFTYAQYADCSGRYSRQPNYRFNPKIEVFSAGFRCCWSEAAPAEADLAAADLALDTRRRLAGASRGATTAYRADDELQAAPGLFIDRYEYPNRAGELPRVAVSYPEASALCARAGKRICTTAEWSLACGGAGRTPYPVGTRPPPPGTCPLGLRGPAPAGSHPGCVTRAGAHDMLGGVWEWSATSLTAPPHLYPAGTVLRQVLGGSWVNPDGEERCNASEGYAAVPQGWRFPELGFRCCRGKAAGAEIEAAAPKARPGSCPAGMARVADFCMDIFEHPNLPGLLPASGLDLAAARGGCAARGLRVCSVAQWGRACGGGRGRPWPYGGGYRQGRCNHALVRPNDLPEAAPSGSFLGCVSADGVFDLSGNLWEWVLRPDGQGELRGGGLNVSAGYGGCHAAARPRASFHTFETGTRCCGPLRQAAPGPRRTIHVLPSAQGRFKEPPGAGRAR